MQTLTQTLIDAELGDRVLTDFQLSRLIEGTSQRRYNLVNRAMNVGELVRLRRGLYMLSEKYRSVPCHPYALAQMLVPGAYVSMETALSFHGWIPEAAYTTTSIVPGRKAKEFFIERMGQFSFYPLAIQQGAFLELVERIELSGQVLLMASPLRALMDLVCYKKIEWQGLSWIEQGMRIDEGFLSGVTRDDLWVLRQVYKHKKVQCFIVEMEIALGLSDD